MAFADHFEQGLLYVLFLGEVLDHHLKGLQKKKMINHLFFLNDALFLNGGIATSC